MSDDGPVAKKARTSDAEHDAGADSSSTAIPKKTATDLSRTEFEIPYEGGMVRHCLHTTRPCASMAALPPNTFLCRAPVPRLACPFDDDDDVQLTLKRKLWESAQAFAARVDWIEKARKEGEGVDGLVITTDTREEAECVCRQPSYLS